MRRKERSCVYLSPAGIAKLADLGRVAEDSQPAGTHFRKVLHRLLIDLSWNSSRLEGNTYSLLETEWPLERGETAEGKHVRDTQMILNHKAAIELPAEQPTEIGFNRYTICNLHALLSDNLLPDPGKGGRLHDHPVGITGMVYRPAAVPQVVEEHFQIFLEKTFKRRSGCMTSIAPGICAMCSCGPTNVCADGIPPFGRRSGSRMYSG